MKYCQGLGKARDRKQNRKSGRFSAGGVVDFQQGEKVTVGYDHRHTCSNARELEKGLESRAAPVPGEAPPSRLGTALSCLARSRAGHGVS